MYAAKSSDVSSFQRTSVVASSSQGVAMLHLPPLRTIWLTLHRWLALGLLLLLVPIAVSGALLVWHDHLAALVTPGRYAVSGAQTVQPSAYLASAAAALGAGSVQPAAVRFPAGD